MATFKQKIEKEINSIKAQLKVKKKSSGGSGSSGGAISSSLSDDFYDEVGKLLTKKYIDFLSINLILYMVCFFR